MKKLHTIIFVLLILSICACKRQSIADPITGEGVIITVIKEYGKSVDWLAEGNLVVTARPLYDEYYDVIIFSMDNPEGEAWLTHKVAGVPQKHNGNPAWHPSGEYIVFTAENPDVLDTYDAVSKPGRGVNCNLWLAKADGSDFWQLTEIETAYMNAGGVLHPQFSHDGNILFWTERIADNPDSYWGHWVIRVATFGDDGIEPPHLTDVQTYDPADQPGFYESHAFSPDDQSILFTGNLKEGQHEVGMDLYTLDLQTETLTRLTTSMDDWDEHAHWSPDGEQIVWMSSTDLDVQWPENMGPLDWRFYLFTELWIMDADGTHQQRLTFYNQPDHPHHRSPRTVVSDSAWSPDGKSLLVLVAHYDGTGPSSKGSAELVLITLPDGSK